MIRSAFALLPLLAVAAAAGAQAPGSLQGGPPPDLATARARAERTLSQPSLPDVAVLPDLAALRSASVASPEAKARADRLIAEAGAMVAGGGGGGFRVRVAEAAALLRGEAWTPAAAYAASLALDPTELVADADAPLHVRLTQVFPAAGGAGTSLRLSLVRRAAAAPPPAPAPETPVRTLWTMPLAGGADLIAHPLPFDVDLTGLADGTYALQGDVLQGGAVVGTTRTAFRVVGGLGAAERELRGRLARLTPRDEVTATILYPFDTARAVNGWRRDIPENLDFAAAIVRSRTLLAAVEAGRDPLWQATGDQRRAYHLAAAGETMPYRLYVPAAWRPGAKLPLLLLLHGGGQNEDSVFPASGRFAGITQRLADQYGMIIVSPLGLRPSGGYGAVYGMTIAGREGLRPGIAASETIPSLSERDTMGVLAAVTAEYGADPNRITVMGNSMGGGGTWYLGGKYAATFAAISPNASSLPFEGFDFARLGKVPVRIVVGSLDAELRRHLAQQAFATLTARHAPVTLTIVPDEVHTTAWYAVLPETIAFLAAQRRQP